ncbi:MAG: hypothetical protein OXF00_10515, partial [bacterium]|nr:hypothetical protein [bacterium]
MRSVGVREFRDQATTLMKLGETIRIERHGKPVGFFVPVPSPKHDGRQIDESLDQLGDVVKRVLAQTGLKEEDLVRALAPQDHQ